MVKMNEYIRERFKDKQGQIDAITHENKIGMVRAAKVLSKEMQDVAKKAGYKSDDVLFITMEKIEGSIVEWQRKNGLVIREWLNGKNQKMWNSKTYHYKQNQW